MQRKCVMKVRKHATGDREGNQRDAGWAAPEWAPVPAGSARLSGTLSRTRTAAQPGTVATPGPLTEFSPSLACAALRSCRARAVGGSPGWAHPARRRSRPAAPPSAARPGRASPHGHFAAAFGKNRKQVLKIMPMAAMAEVEVAESVRSACPVAGVGEIVMCHTGSFPF